MLLFPIYQGGGSRTDPLSLFTGFRLFLYAAQCRAGRFLTGLFFCTLLLAMPVTAKAQSGDSAAALKTQIVTNEEKGPVTIVIDGKPVVMIDKTGLHVVGDVEYGGTMTDTGGAYIEKAIAEGDDDAE